MHDRSQSGHKAPRNNTKKFRFLLFCLFAICGWPFSAGAQVKDEGPNAEARLGFKVRQLCDRQNFDELESLAASLRENARFADGSWKLPAFYDAFDLERVTSSSGEWAVVRTRLEAWQTARPESSTAKIALANWWHAFAWQARGKGWSDTVTPEQWKLFKERLIIAEELLNIAADSPIKCPARELVLQRVALSSGWPHERYLQMAEAAITANPDFTPYSIEAVRYLLPRWYGQPGEWERFAVKSGSAEMFTRLVWSNAAAVPNLFTETDIRWEPMKEGFVELRKQYPDSDWVLNQYARFACLAEDRATAKELFASLQGHYQPAAWPGQEQFEKWRKWASE